MNTDVAIIGSGPGGYVAAIRAAQLGLKTLCIEKAPTLGGTCLNVGCIPSKALLHSSQHLDTPFSAMMARKEQIISQFNAGIQGLFQKNKITHLIGTAQFADPHTLLVNDGTTTTSVTAKFIVLATGSEPIPLPFLPFDEKRILSSTGALALSSVPKHLLVIGAGVIGVELGSVYKRLGAQVTCIEFLDRICPTFDKALSTELQKALEAQGIRFLLKTKVTGVSPSGAILTDSQSFDADAVLVSIGRRPTTDGLNLNNIGIIPDAKGFIPIDRQFRTKQPHIFAIGDIVDGPMLAHKASEEGVAVAEIIAGHTPTIKYIAIPNVVYTEPEVASVGLSEEEATQAGLRYLVGQFPFKANSRAKCTDAETGFVKVMAEEKTDRIIGVHIIGTHASELIGEASLAITHGITAAELAATCHPHPTLSEALKEASLAVHKRALHK